MCTIDSMGSRQVAACHSVSAYPRSLLLLVTVLLSACSGLQTSDSDNASSRKVIEQRLLAIECWELSGKLGIRTPEEAHGIWMQWRQQRADYEMRLSGPLGVGGAEISGGPGRVEMRVSEDQVLTGTSPEALVERELGWRLPLSSLIYWVRGVRAPGPIGQQRLNDQNLLAELNQHGWLLEFLAYSQMPENLPALPAKVRLTHQDLKVTVVIKDWESHVCA